MLTNIDEPHLPQVINQLREAIDQIDVKVNDAQLVKITVSMGIAKYQYHDDIAAMLYERADSYLYVAKKDGKNSVNYEGNKLIK